MPESIYRYKLSSDIYEIIIAFAKLHQYDDRKDYKEAWKLLVEVQTVEFAAEKERLHKQGYKGDVLDKMYKSGRYYFKEKSSRSDTKPRREKASSTIKLSKRILETMDTHLKSTNRPVKPSEGFDQFCRDHVEVINQEVEMVGVLEEELLLSKLKKSYKNRYFTIQKNKIYNI